MNHYIHDLSIYIKANKEEGESMLNWRSKRTRRVISTIIIILLVISMTLPAILSIFK